MFKFENSHEFHLKIVRVTGQTRGQYFLKGIAVYFDGNKKKVRRIAIRFNPFNPDYHVYKYCTLLADINDKDPRLKKIIELYKEMIPDYANRPITNTKLRVNVKNTAQLLLNHEVESAHINNIPKEIKQEIIGIAERMAKGKAPVKYDTRGRPYFADSGTGQFWLEDLGEAMKGIDYK